MAKRDEAVTIGELKALGYKPVAVREEIRRNLIAMIKEKKEIFPGIIGYDNTVIPRIENAIISGQDIIFLGERGQAAWDLARQALSTFRLRRTVGVATINALSACLMAEKGIPGGRLLSNTDALDVVRIENGDRVVLVGAFIPFIRKLKDQRVELKVIDKHRDALKGEELLLWASPDSAAELLRKADVAIITGSALVEGGMDYLLELCAGVRQIVLAGPTASPWPEPFFARGVTVLGGIRVHDGAKFMRLVAEGGSGYFFSGPAEKIAVVKGG